MVVYGGIHLLAEDDDDDLFGQRKSTDRVTAPTSVYLPPRRAWFSMYNQRVTVPVSPAEAARRRKLGLIQRALSDDMMLEIFKRMSPVAVARAACSCRPWRLLATHEDIWERAALDAWSGREPPEVTARVCRDRYHNSWRRMFLDRVRMRTEGLYVSRNTYIKAGMTDLTTENVNPVHMVCYYRYFRFFGTGEFYCKTSPHKLESVAKTFRDRRASAVDPNMYYGWYSIADVDGEEGPDESRLHLECAPVERLTGDGRASSSLHMWLRLRSTHPGGSNRLDFVKFASVDEAEPVPAPTAEEWREIDDPEMAYRRSCGINVRRYVGHARVRELSRGLNTMVFVPWEDVHDHVLNQGTDKMDFFVTG